MIADRAHHTGAVTHHVTYGDDVPGDDQLHLIGDVAGGRRVIELGISGNSVALAEQGAKAIALDPDPERIADLRADASRVGVSVECHYGELADLGFAPSGTIDVVLASHTLEDDEDLSRTLRQVHRVLKPGAPLVLALDHPFAAVGLTADGVRQRYGDGQRTVGELLTALARTNFRIEVFHELGVDDDHPVPTTLVVKARQARRVIGIVEQTLSSQRSRRSATVAVDAYPLLTSVTSCLSPRSASRLPPCTPRTTRTRLQLMESRPASTAISQ